MVVNYVAVSGRPAASPAYAAVAEPTVQVAAECSQETHLPVETTWSRFQLQGRATFGRSCKELVYGVSLLKVHHSSTSWHNVVAASSLHMGPGRIHGRDSSPPTRRGENIYFPMCMGMKFGRIVGELSSSWQYHSVSSISTETPISSTSLRALSESCSLFALAWLLEDGEEPAWFCALVGEDATGTFRTSDSSRSYRILSLAKSYTYARSNLNRWMFPLIRNVKACSLSFSWS